MNSSEMAAKLRRMVPVSMADKIIAAPLEYRCPDCKAPLDYLGCEHGPMVFVCWACKQPWISSPQLVRSSARPVPANQPTPMAPRLVQPPPVAPLEPEGDTHAAGPQPVGRAADGGVDAGLQGDGQDRKHNAEKPEARGPDRSGDREPDARDDVAPDPREYEITTDQGTVRATRRMMEPPEKDAPPLASPKRRR